MQPVLVKVSENGYAVAGVKSEGIRLDLETLLAGEIVPDSPIETEEKSK
jgi:hypothetical protein